MGTGTPAEATTVVTSQLPALGCQAHPSSVQQPDNSPASPLALLQLREDVTAQLRSSWIFKVTCITLRDGGKQKTSHISFCALFPNGSSVFCNMGALQTGSTLGNPQEQSPGCPRGASEQRPAGTAPWRYRTRCTMPKTAQLCSRTWAKNLCPPLRSRHGAGQSILQGCRLTSIAQDGFFCPKKSSGRGYTCSELAVQATTSHLLEQHSAGVLPRDKGLGATPTPETSWARGEEKGDGASRKARRERRNCCHQLCSCSGS